MSTITVKEISSKKDKNKFFKFYVDLYKGNKYAAPNLFVDEKAEFDPQINDAFRFCECKMFLAYRDKKIVGRVAGIWHKGANEKSGLKQLRFTRFDVIDDFEVTKALFDKLNDWAKQLGMTEIIGPMSFSDLNEEGMLIDGFDQDSTYIEIYNHEYYVKHMEMLGAYKVVDWNCYRITVPDENDENVQRLKRMSEVISKRQGYQILDVEHTPKKQLEDYVMQALTVLDEAFRNLYGFSPLSEKQKQREMETIFSVLKPEYATVLLHDGKVVAYGFMWPSMSNMMRKARGKLFPRGIIPYIKAMHKPYVAELGSIGVTDEHLKRGATAIIMSHCLEGLYKNGTKYLETGPELETNDNVQNLWKNYEKVLNKRHRCWGLQVK
ncbi:MAG: hypothetical protein NC350_00610 [Corallococcus sp.]|nr:hypothetical protein [Corallococcus sp.]